MSRTYVRIAAMLSLLLVVLFAAGCVVPRTAGKAASGVVRTTGKAAGGAVKGAVKGAGKVTKGTAKAVTAPVR